MRKTWIILAILVMFALVSTVSAVYPPPNGPKPMTFTYSGDIVVKYVFKSADYDNAFGLFSPGAPLFLAKIKNLPFNTVYETDRRCTPGKSVVAYITTPGPNDPLPRDPHGPQTYYSDASSVADGLQHADVSGPVDGPYRVGFEDIYDGGSSHNPADYDFDDVVLEVSCTPDQSIPEFPTMAFPAALIVGMLGAVLFIQRTKEN